MGILAVLISGAALVVSFASFYFNYLRKKRGLYLVAVKHLERASFVPEIVLMNGGSEDILVTDARYSFKEENRSASPAQSVEHAESTWLIPTGKGLHVRIRFVESLTSTFITSVPLSDGIHQHQLYFDIDWVQGDGIRNRRSVKIATVGIAPDGDVRRYTPAQFVADLYCHPPVKGPML